MLTEWLLIAWIGTTTNFIILHVDFTEKGCIEEKNVWMLVLNNNAKLECVTDLKEGRSLFPSRGFNHGLVK
jgi:hypothetical protein